jgi:regulator of sigma E protease
VLASCIREPIPYQHVSMGGYCRLKDRRPQSSPHRWNAHIHPHRRSSLFSVHPSKRVVTYLQDPWQTFCRHSLYALKHSSYAGGVDAIHRCNGGRLSNLIRRCFQPASRREYKAEIIVVKLNGVDVADWEDLSPCSGNRRALKSSRSCAGIRIGVHRCRPRNPGLLISVWADGTPAGAGRSVRPDSEEYRAGMRNAF